MVSGYEILGKQLENFDPSCAFHLLGMMDLLHIKSTESPKNGDLVFFDENTGINIYDISGKVDEVFRLLNAILFFTGNPEVESLDHHANSGLLKPKLIRLYAKDQDELYVKKEGKLQRKLEDLYLFFSDSIIPVGYFEKTNRRIKMGFSNRDELARLLSGVRSFIDCYHGELLDAEGSGEDLSDGGAEFVKKAGEKFDGIINIYRLSESLKFD